MKQGADDLDGLARQRDDVRGEGLWLRGGGGVARMSRSAAGFSGRFNSTIAKRKSWLNQVRHFSAVVSALRCSTLRRTSSRSCRVISKIDRLRNLGRTSLPKMR